MSPPETLDSNYTGAGPAPLPVSLEHYAITPNGFLPEDPPLDRLPSFYYSPWESLMDSLSTSLAQRTLRAHVDCLPILSANHLVTEPEWRRAYVVLGFLTHAYIWGGDTAAEILPPAITLPFLTVSSHLGLPPIATYASLNLWNYHITPSSSPPTCLDALHAQHTFTGTPDESWFYVVSVAMEARGGALLPCILDALECCSSSSSDRAAAVVTAALVELAACVGDLGALLERMDERCDPQVFYHRIRPFLAGSKNMATAGLPSGVFYDEGDGKGEWRQLRGGSNGQSSLIQFLDVVLGVEHTAVGDGRSKGIGNGVQEEGEREVGFHEEVRAYMPEPHRRFLEFVAERYSGGMRKAVADLLAVGEEEDGGLSAEQRALQDAFEAATRALAEFRNKHLQIVARYIIIPSRQPNANRGLNLATASSRVAGAPQVEGWKGRGGGDGELTGTGGTALLPFLKQSRDETFQAGQLEVR